MDNVRISAGMWRSRVLRFSEVKGLRPTPNRVRQTLFNWLGQDLTGLHCLDLFAGTGVMGFEALSRGAAKAILVEKSHIAIRCLQKNKEDLQAQALQIVHADALDYLHQCRERFDIIFLDPPFYEGWLPKILSQLSQHLTDDGVVYVEAEHELTFDHQFEILKKGTAGQVFFHLLKKI